MRGKVMRGLVFPLAAAMMLVPTTAFAEDATEELNQILEAQFSAETESLLGEYLGLDALQEAFAANGMQVQAQVGLTEGSGALLDGTIPEGAFLNLGFTHDPNAKQWLLSLGMGLDDKSLLDASLYGDESMLALSLPQFCSNALGIRAGSFLEQYDNSGLKEYLGLGDLGIDDFNLSFYPETSGTNAEDDSLEADVSENMQQAIDDFLATGFSMTKTETEDGATYVAVVDTDAVLELYGTLAEGYLDTLDEMGILDLYTSGASSSYSTEDMDLMETIEATMEDFSALFGEESTLTFHVQDDLVQMITWQCDVYESDEEHELDDGEDLMAAGDDLAAEEETEGVDAAAAEETEDSGAAADEPVGNISISFVPDDPAQPDEAFTLQILLEECETGDTAAIRLSKQTEQTGTLTETTISATVMEYDEIEYDDTVYRISFDSATGELDMTVGVTDPDSGEYSGLKLTSVFHDVAQGSSFGWTIEELSIVSEDESYGLIGEISVQADPGTMETPDTTMILEADADELTYLVMEIYMNAMTWVEDFEDTWNAALGIESESEDYGYDYGSDEEYLYDDGSDDDTYWYDDEVQTEVSTLDGASA